MSFFLNRSEFRQKLIGYVISAGKTSGVLRGGASGANRGYVLAHCGVVGKKVEFIFLFKILVFDV